MMALFDTTSRAVGGRLGPRGRASRESHPSEDLSELPPLLVAVAGQEYHYWIAGEGRAGLPRSPAAMRNSPPQAVLWTDGNRSAPYLAVFDAGASRTDGLGASYNVAAASLSGADVSKLPDMTASRRCFSKFNEDMFSSHLIRQKSAFLKPSFKVFFYFLYCRDNRFSDCSMGNPLYLSDPCQGISIQKEAESALLEIS